MLRGFTWLLRARPTQTHRRRVPVAGELERTVYTAAAAAPPLLPQMIYCAVESLSARTVEKKDGGEQSDLTHSSREV